MTSMRFPVALVWSLGMKMSYRMSVNLIIMVMTCVMWATSGMMVKDIFFSCSMHYDVGTKDDRRIRTLAGLSS